MTAACQERGCQKPQDNERPGMGLCVQHADYVEAHEDGKHAAMQKGCPDCHEEYDPISGWHEH